MRLHKISLLNLNSLYGEQSLDLDRDLQGASLFLIHGRTGAGKSTIMDAVSLALFGKTPRLDAQRNAPGSDPSGIMSRGTGECRAAVEFSRLFPDGTRGRYRATWSVRRARKRADGAVQPVEQSLERLATQGQWELLASGKKQILYKQILDEVLDGFSLEDFHRSMLLAQGRFDELLSAKPEHRATILERLTNTEEYKSIGSRAAELASAHRKNIDYFRRQLGDATPIGEEEWNQAERNLALASERAQLSVRALAEAKAHLDWWQERQRLDRGLRELELEQRSLANVAEQLAPISSQVAEHQRCSQGFGAIDRNLELNGRHTKLSAEIERARAALQEATALREQRSLLRETDEQRAQRAEELRLGIQTPAAQLAAARETAMAAKKSLDGARERQVTLQAELSRRKEAIAQAEIEVARATEDTAQAKALAASIARTGPVRDWWREQGQAQCIGLQSREQNLERASVELTESEQRLEVESKRHAGEVEEQAKQRAARLAEPEAMLAKWRQRLTELVGGEEPRERVRVLRGAVSQTQSDVVALEAARRELLARGALETELDQAKVKLADAEQSAAAAAIRAAEARAAANQTALRHADADKQLQRLELVVEISRRRDTLRAGQECPLCGSSEHPYLDEPGRCPDETVVRRALTEASRECAALSTLSRDQENLARQAELTAERCRLEQDALREVCTNISTKLAHCAADWEKAQSAAGLPADCQSGPCNELLAAQRVRLESVQRELGDVEQALDALEQAQQRLGAVQGALVAHEEALNAKRIELEQREQMSRERRVQLAELRREFEAARDAFGAKLRQIDRELDAAPEPNEPMLAGLRRKVEVAVVALDQAERASERAENRLREAVSQRELQVAAIGDAERLLTSTIVELEAQQAEYRRICERGQAWLAELRELWRAGLQDAGAESGAVDGLSAAEILELARQDAAKLREQASLSRKQAEAASRDEVQRQGMLNALLDVQVTLERERAGAQRELWDVLSALGFDSEEPLLARRMHPDALRDAQARIAELARQQQDLQIRQDERRQALEQHEALAPAGLASLDRGSADVPGALGSPPEPSSQDQAIEARLSAAVSDAELKLKTAQDGERESHFKWEDTKRRRQEYAAAGELLAKATAQSEVWLLLDSLIGTRNGDVLREFAQGLNLHRLIQKANVHLQRLSERYLLTQAREADAMTLDFAIRDLWQGGEPRSTRTLSGGERFLVSLALALGLSDLRVQRLPIETLILDEGFGTLDPETLEIALGALQRLHADGRQVGVISHVVGLKERIPAQVRIVEEGGGRSRIVVGKSER